jgi:glucose-6-phosphate 1-dehydrogenase
VRAQYAAGTVGDRSVTAYRKAENVDPKSTTETYVALKLGIDNWRWAGVPFYLRTGKALCARRTEVAIKFKQAPFRIFSDTPVDRLAQNFLILSIQPDEGITLQFNAKVPGPVVDLEGVGMSFKYKDYFDAAPSTGYETLIYDCMVGDATLFQRADSVEAGWRAVQPFLEAWHGNGRDGLATYKAGSDGPKEAAALLADDGRRWRSLR